MAIIHKYVVRETLKYFTIVLLFVVGIYVAVDFFEKIDDFMEKGVAIGRVVSFFGLKTPFILAQITPVGLLLAVIVTIGVMRKNHELIALQSSGISVYFLLRPILLLGAAASIGLFALSDLIVPPAMEKANQIWLTEVKGETRAVSRKKDVWIRDGQRIVHLKYYDPTREMIFGVTIHQFDDRFRLIRRIDAEKGALQSGDWVLGEVMLQTFEPDGDGYTVTFPEKLAVALDLSPDRLGQIAKKAEEMRFSELLRYVRHIEALGYGAVALRVDLYAKIAFPFVCIIMCMAGAGVAAGKRTREGLATGIVFGIVIAFVYWVFYSFCVSLGYGGMLPPLVSVWVANFVFVCLGILLLQRVE